MRVTAASKEKYAALRRKRRRLRSVGLRPRAMGALRGLAALATPPTEKHPARCLRHSRIKGRLPTRVCLRRVGPTSLLPPPASPAPSALPAATSMAFACKTTLYHCAPFTPPLPRTSSAARRSSSQKCLRSSCVRRAATQGERTPGKKKTRKPLRIRVFAGRWALDQRLGTEGLESQYVAHP